ncbi:mediator of RNA polymerase II transcription subunit 27 [Elysia marginata]|uniref:Mediator of RNA polymerase II transcription subunit 27 n=1 Tax=Elysia marginata TaxID=1093978 RepID=A0AAV4HIN2_9GAST|nr:mediator of RNA polymerase II transcription subunit 27 [Elysia marginata]
MSDQADHILQSIHLVQKLRSGVGQVFKDLSDGISEYSEDPQNRDDTENQGKAEGASASSKESKSAQSSKESGSDKAEDQKHRAILKTLKKSLETISHDFSDLEKTGASIGPVQLFSNIDNLSLDPHDKNAVMHSQLLQSYKWTNKMHELASQAVSILSQNTLKRTQVPKFTNAKKQKVNMLAACQVPQASVDQLILQLDQTYPDSSISIHRPLGGCGIMQIELGHTLRAVVVLRGLMIEWVKVKGFGESFKNEDGQFDIWTASRYQVFQKVTDNAEAASLRFYAPAMPQLAIKSFVLWLNGYKTLFSAPCVKCGKFLLNNIPPTWRDYRSREPYHDVCRP